jgi:transcriptional regulator with XRE-family HTH domain
MKERLNKLIETEGLTPSLFADKLGINRPTVSHVLTGRNNPGYDFIQKILIAFPKLNAEWLLLGNGDMYKKAHHANNVNDLFSFPAKQVVSTPPHLSSPTLSDNSVVGQPAPTIAQEQKNALSPDNPEKTLFAKAQKPIDRIVILFSDNTFSDFLPS